VIFVIKTRLFGIEIYLPAQTENMNRNLLPFTGFMFLCAVFLLFAFAYLNGGTLLFFKF